MDNALLEKSKVLTNKLDAFCEHEYSKAVFDVFSKIAPKIVKMDGEYYDWSQVFGSDYFALSGQQKSDLVSLIEGGGAYRLSAEYYEEIEIDNVSLKSHKTNRKLKDSDLF